MNRIPTCWKIVVLVTEFILSFFICIFYPILLLLVMIEIYVVICNYHLQHAYAGRRYVRVFQSPMFYVFSINDYSCWCM